ncbi:ABC transporter permease [Hyperthermus butylicus]|uniref:ABC-type dipeptide/oligopeptide/nickel transport system, permease n=1 Tax=Hyperthermus butylicus (strain DSM 5456 / JCM 9403 / PLM1-5) TaxID=415426 RepID=A2BKF5_HYPBU|nr:ABC transporter permease [Hyperthermus butylicus]ABM80466.1 ABC-type dipeptide/oligopeptide/nickel transport system, permease [Hyperthermus butylicus DSM 5456]
MPEYVYEKKILDRLADKLVDGLAIVIDRVRPGWKLKNQGRLEEWKLMLYTLNRSPLGLTGLVLVAAFVILAIIGPYIAPVSYDTQFIFCEKTKKPGEFESKLAPPGTTIEIRNSTYCRRVGLEPGNFTFILGSDNFGRDLYSRILYGARTSLVVAILVVSVGATIGILLGLVAGYYGGAVDEVIMRITDIFLAFPGLILAIAFSATLPYALQGVFEQYPNIATILRYLFAVKPEHEPALASLASVIIALWMVWWPSYTRLVRGMVLSVRENTYVEAARALGVSTLGIMFRHILPNMIGPVLVYVTMDMGGVILTEAGLSYLGLGVVPPLADWGRIIFDGAQYFPRAWWLIFWPGLMIFLTVFGFNLLGDALRDILDPRTRRSIEFKVKKVVEAEEEAAGGGGE